MKIIIKDIDFGAFRYLCIGEDSKIKNIENILDFNIQAIGDLEKAIIEANTKNFVFAILYGAKNLAAFNLTQNINDRLKECRLLIDMLVIYSNKDAQAKINTTEAISLNKAQQKALMDKYAWQIEEFEQNSKGIRDEEYIETRAFLETLRKELTHINITKNKNP